MIRVYWKSEWVENGRELGPCFVVTADPDPTQLGRPYQPKCECGGAVPRSEVNEWGYPVCDTCGRECEPVWITEEAAARIAAGHGVELES